MIRFIVISFALLGWAFYELSGGADFEPRKPRPEVAVAETAEPRRSAEADQRDPQLETGI